MKTCNKCNLKKTEDSFQLRKDTGKRRSECNSCRDLYNNTLYNNRCLAKKAHATHKTCNVCKNELPITSFGKYKGCLDGHTPQCKLCRKSQSSKSYEKNKAAVLIKQKEKYYNNHEESLKYSRECYHKNGEVNRARKREYNKSERGRQVFREWQALQMKTNNLFRAKKNLRNRYNAIIRQYRIKKRTSSVKSINSSFIDYITDQFMEGMTWDNYGKGFGKWSIDHYIPLSYLQIDSSVQEELNHFFNLTPMWNSENTKKSDTLPEDYLEHLAYLKSVVNDKI